MEIRTWLKSKRDYEQGRALYEKHSPLPVLKKLFSLGPSAYNTKKLAAELEKLQEPEPKPGKAVAPIKESDKAAHNNAAESILVQLRPMLAEQAALQAQLDMPQPKEARFKRAHAIMQLADKVEPLWRDYHYAKEHGTLPEKQQKQLPKTEVDMVRRLNNLRTYRTRYQNRPDKLQEIVEEIKQLEEQLNGN